MVKISPQQQQQIRGALGLQEGELLGGTSPEGTVSTAFTTGAKKSADSAAKTVAAAGTTPLEIQEAKTSGIPTDLTQAPATPVDTTAAANIAGILANTQAGIDEVNQQIAELQAQQQEAPPAEQPQNAFQQTMSQLASAITGRQEARQQAPTALEQQRQIQQQVFSQFGLTPESLAGQQTLIGELTALSKQQADLEAQKSAMLLGAEQRLQGFTKGVLRGEQGLIERQFNSRIAAKAAQAAVVGQQLQLQRGLIQDAQQMTNQILQLSLHDEQQKINDFEWAFDTYQDLFGIMDSRERAEWDREFRESEADLGRKQQDRLAKLNLITQAAQEGINLGWTMADIENRSLEDLTSQFGQRVSTQAGVAGLTFLDDTLQAAVDQGATPEQAVFAAQSVAQGLGINLSTKNLQTIRNRAGELTPQPGVTQTLFDTLLGRNRAPVPQSAQAPIAQASEQFTPIGDGLFLTPQGGVTTKGKTATGLISGEDATFENLYGVSF